MSLLKKGRRSMTRLKRLLSAAAIIFVSIQISASTNIRDSQVFERWITQQFIFEEQDLNNFYINHQKVFTHAFKQTYTQNVSQLRTLVPFLSKLTNNCINELGYKLEPQMDVQMVGNLQTLQNLIESNTPAFIDWLKASNFVDNKLELEEVKKSSKYVLEKYKILSSLLFSTQNSVTQQETLFTFANSLFEYCFNDATCEHYTELLMTPKYHPIARYINTTMWFNLVGEGWKHWHKDCLTNLKADSKNGKEIVYIAGGCDFYELLKQGIYNIRIIDPFIPTQEKYFSEGWQFLLDGNIGDEINFGFDAKEITLIRNHDESSFYISTTPVNQTTETNKLPQTIKQKTITWLVVDKFGNELGNVIIERRFATKKDFEPSSTKTLLMSYCEAVYTSLPSIIEGWDIDISSFDKDFKMYVKQLRKPITKNHMLNIRLASVINLASLEFINYGSNPN